MNRRTFLASSVAGIGGTSIAIHADEPVPRSNLGLLLYSYGFRARRDARKEFARPANFLSFAHERGANAVQLALGICDEKDCLAIRRLAEKREMAIEGIVAPPKDTAIDRDRFNSELKTAQACGAMKFFKERRITRLLRNRLQPHSKRLSQSQLGTKFNSQSRTIKI